MPSSSVSHSKNSTNVRSLPLGLRAIGAGLRALEAGSPSLAAKVGTELMFRTSRHTPKPSERELLQGGERFTVVSEGVRLAAWSFGQGPTVLLVHGWNGRGGQLGGYIEPFVKRGFRVVTFDSPGHGESDGHQSSLVEFANAVDAMLTATGSPFVPAHAVIAHSMGGAAVTYAMSRHRRMPVTEHERALRDDLPVRRFAFIAPPIDVRDFVNVFTRMAGLNSRTHQAISRGIESRFAMRLEDLYAPTLAGELNAPLLVVHDQDDREVPLSCGRLLAESWPGAQLEVTHGLGHQRILHDDDVIKRVVSFLAD